MDVVKLCNLSIIDNGVSIVLNGGLLRVIDDFGNGDLFISNGMVNFGSGNFYVVVVCVNSVGMFMFNGGGGNINLFINNGIVSVVFNGEGRLLVGSDGIINNGMFNISGCVNFSGDVINNVNVMLVFNGDVVVLSVIGNVSVSNYGILMMVGGNVSVSYICNEVNGIILGNGMLLVSGLFINDGIFVLGGDGIVGCLVLWVIGDFSDVSFSQGDIGKMLIDIVGVGSGSYDVIELIGFFLISLDGSFKICLLSGYLFVGEVSINVINISGILLLIGYFCFVIGDIVMVGGQEKMFKVVYGDNGLVNFFLCGVEIFIYQQYGYLEGGWEDC